MRTFQPVLDKQPHTAGSKTGTRYRLLGLPGLVRDVFLYYHPSIRAVSFVGGAACQVTIDLPRIMLRKNSGRGPVPITVVQHTEHWGANFHLKNEDEKQPWVCPATDKETCGVARVGNVFVIESIAFVLPAVHDRFGTDHDKWTDLGFLRGLETLAVLLADPANWYVEEYKPTII